MLTGASIDDVRVALVAVGAVACIPRAIHSIDAATMLALARVR
jgi:hypothetical protein